MEPPGWSGQQQQPGVPSLPVQPFSKSGGQSHCPRLPPALPAPGVEETGDSASLGPSLPEQQHCPPLRVVLTLSCLPIPKEPGTASYTKALTGAICSFQTSQGPCTPFQSTPRLETLPSTGLWSRARQPVPPHFSASQTQAQRGGVIRGNKQAGPTGLMASFLSHGSLQEERRPRAPGSVLGVALGSFFFFFN